MLQAGASPDRAWVRLVLLLVLVASLSPAHENASLNGQKLIGQETTMPPEEATGIPGQGIRYATDDEITALHEDGTIWWTWEGQIFQWWSIPGGNLAVLDRHGTLTFLDAEGHTSWTRQGIINVVADDDDTLVLHGGVENSITRSTWTGARISDGTTTWTITGPIWDGGWGVPGWHQRTHFIYWADLPSAFLTGNADGGVEARSVATGQVLARVPDAARAWVAHSTLVAVTERSGTCTATVTTLAPDPQQRRGEPANCAVARVTMDVMSVTAISVVGDTLVFSLRSDTDTDTSLVIGLTRPATTERWYGGGEHCYSTTAGVGLLRDEDEDGVTGIDPMTGQPLWHIDGHGAGYGADSTTEIVFRGSGEPHVTGPRARNILALDPATGQVLVSVPTVGYEPVVAGDGWFIAETIDMHSRSTTRLITLPGYTP